MGGGLACCHLRLGPVKITSHDLAQFSLWLFSSTQAWILWNLEDLDASLLAGTMKYVSSANLRRKLPEDVVLRSPALTVYAAGPMADPCIMLAFMLLKSDVWPQNDVQCECPVKKSASQL